jgi:hypothetical protein
MCELAFTVYVSGYTETDLTEMLSPNNGRLSGANKVGLLPADSLARYVMQRVYGNVSNGNC